MKEPEVIVMPQFQRVCRPVVRIKARQAGKGEILKGSVSNTQEFELHFG